MKSRIYLGVFLLSAAIFQSCSKKDSTPPPGPTPVPGCATNTSPANGAFVTGGTNLTLSWTAVSGATGYDVYWGSSPNPANVLVSNITGTSYTFTLPVFQNSQPLYWYVKPRNSSGSSNTCHSTSTLFTVTVIEAPPPFG
jgi:hypothetical protein